MRDNKTTAVRYLTETPLLLASQENKEGREGPGYDGFIYFSNKNFCVIFAVTPQSLKEVMEDVIVLGKKQV